MVLPLDALWLGVLIAFLAVFCTAFLMSPRLWFALILAVIVVGLVLTIVSVVSKRRRKYTELSREETMLLEYLKSHGIGGSLSELASTLDITEEKTLNLLISMEEKGAIPPGSVKILAPDKSITAKT